MSEQVNTPPRTEEDFIALAMEYIHSTGEGYRFEGLNIEKHAFESIEDPNKLRDFMRQYHMSSFDEFIPGVSKIGSEEMERYDARLLRLSEVQAYVDFLISYYGIQNISVDIKGSSSPAIKALREVVYHEQNEFITNRNNNLTALHVLAQMASSTDTSANQRHAQRILDSHVENVRQELIAEREAIVAEMQEQNANYEPDYLVRGALLKCAHGSHMRYLNLPIDHNVRVNNLPLINKLDAVPNKNVMYFGHCLSTTPPDPGDRIRLQPYVPVSKDGYALMPQPNVTTLAPRCIPQFNRHEWEHTNCRVGVGLGCF